MAYDVHIVRTKDWLEAATSPITKEEVDAAIAADRTLEWSGDYVDMSAGSSTARYYMIAWNSQPCFWWYQNEIRCSSPDDKQIAKLVQLAKVFNAYVVGDDGEIYTVRKDFLGREKVIRSTAE